ncbi:hypothetical protein DL771_003038 [Monosporascus sp. 5C6A]|nr:hypothetical protein DL771_003038 [Monosporascus sp. 5C6A]
MIETPGLEALSTSEAELQTPEEIFPPTTEFPWAPVVEDPVGMAEYLVDTEEELEAFDIPVTNEIPATDSPLEENWVKPGENGLLPTHDIREAVPPTNAVGDIGAAEERVMEIKEAQGEWQMEEPPLRAPPAGKRNQAPPTCQKPPREILHRQIPIPEKAPTKELSKEKLPDQDARQGKSLQERPGRDNLMQEKQPHQTLPQKKHRQRTLKTQEKQLQEKLSRRRLSFGKNAPPERPTEAKPAQRMPPQETAHQMKHPIIEPLQETAAGKKSPRDTILTERLIVIGPSHEKPPKGKTKAGFFQEGPVIEEPLEFSHFGLPYSYRRRAC